MALSPYSPPDLQDAPSTATPLSSANLESWFAGAGGHADALNTQIEARRVHVWQQTGVAANGSTDDTTAIQALINAAGVATVFDFGDARHSYVINTLTMKSGHSYVARGATLIHKPGATEGIFKYKDVSAPRVQIEDILVEGFEFQGEVSGAAEAERSAVYIYSGTRVIVRDCIAYDFKSAAYHVQESGDVTYDNLRAYRCSNYGGRNAIEILGSQDTLFADTADVSHTWTIRNCKADLAGAPSGGAGGICMIANDAQNIRGHMDGNWAFNCLTFGGIVAEAGFTRYSTITNNKAFCCKVGVYNVDTQSDHGTTVVQDRVVISGNIVDCRNRTTNTPTDNTGSVTVVPGADLPNAIGMDVQPSHSTITGNIVRATGDGIKLRGNATTTVRATGTVLSNNQVTMANANAGLSVFGFYLNYLTDLNIHGNHVEREAGSTMKDAYYLDDVAGMTWEGNSSRGAGRNAIRLATSVSLAMFNGGVHLDPASNEAAEGVLIGATTGMSDLHFGGGMLIKDTKGTPTMTYGLNFGVGSIPTSTTGELQLKGWVTSAVNGANNLAVDQSRLFIEDKTPRTFGQNTHRRGRHTTQPTTAGWSVGDRIDSTIHAAGATGAWGCSASGNPGTWRPLYVVPGVATVATDADFTLTAGTDKPTQLHTGTLTATRSIGLATTANVVLEGHKFRVTRTGGGAFNLQVGTGPLKSLATGQWCDVEYDGGNWKLTAYGTL